MPPTPSSSPPPAPPVPEDPHDAPPVSLPSPPPSPPSPHTTTLPSKHSFKVVIIGDAGVGKTSLRNRYLTSSFSLAYHATVGVDFVAKTLQVGDTPVSLSIWDTAGQDRFRSLGRAFYRGADACILVYSSPASLDSLTSWFNEFKDKCPVSEEEGRNFVWVAVGAKVDLWDDKEGAAGLSEKEVAAVLDGLVPRNSTNDSANEAGEARGYTVGTPPPSSPNPSSHSSPKAAESPITHCRNHSYSSQPSTSSRIDVLSPRRGQHHSILRNKRTSASMATTATTSSSIYHTPSSSLHGNESVESFASDSTVTAGAQTPADADADGSGATPTPPEDEEEQESNNSSKIFAWSDSTQEHLSAERQRGLARGIDVFMASSPPRPPSTLIGTSSLRYFGGPSALRKKDTAAAVVKEVKTRDGDVTSEGRSEDTAVTAGVPLDDYDYSQDGIKTFRTSAKTGKGVDELFDYVARRALWKVRQDELEEQHRELGGEVIDVQRAGKGGKWRQACCS